MARALFINGTAQGHLNPTFPLVRELVRRGEEVCYCSTEEFRGPIEASGAVFLSYGSGVEAFLKGFRPSGDHPFYTLIEFLLSQDIAMSEAALQISGGRKFDYVLHDAMLGGGNIVARALGIPAVCTCTSFAPAHPPVPPQMLARGFHPQLDRIYEQLDSLASKSCEKPGVMDVFFKREDLNVVFTSRLFQPEGESFDASFRFVGPSLEGRQERDADFLKRLQGKLIYISMGTINNGCTEFYRKCMEAFADGGLTVAMSVGRRVDIASLGEIPNNFIVRNYMPQLEILRRCGAFVSHAGLNSVSEALYYGVPVAAIPQANDQPEVAARLEALGAGIRLKMAEVTPELLRETVQRLLSDASYAAACRAIGESLREAGGAKAAADCILAHVAGLRAQEKVTSRAARTPSP